MWRVLLNIILYSFLNGATTYPQYQENGGPTDFERKLYPEPYNPAPKPHIMPRPPIDRFQHNPFLAGYDNHPMGQPFGGNHHHNHQHQQNGFNDQRIPNNQHNMDFFHNNHMNNGNHNNNKPFHHQDGLINGQENVNNQDMALFQDIMNVKPNNFKPTQSSIEVLSNSDKNETDLDENSEKNNEKNDYFSLQPNANTTNSFENSSNNSSINQDKKDTQHLIDVRFSTTQENKKLDEDNGTDDKNDDRIVFSNDEPEESQNPETTVSTKQDVENSKDVTTMPKVEISLFQLANVKSNCKTDVTGKCREEYS